MMKKRNLFVQGFIFTLFFIMIINLKRYIMNSKFSTVISIITVYIFCSTLVLSLGVKQSFAEQGKSYVLGEIADNTISEGELLNFTIGAPAGFGPDVTWTATSPDLTEKELEGMFYDVPAFPGAEGFGAGTSGGRGGRVIKVTNLNSDGPGSLKEALLVNEPRIIVFDVSGVINATPITMEYNMSKSARFYTANAPLTIAGQTASGAGITFNGQLSLTTGDGGVATDNAVARFLRIRSPYHRPGVGDNINFGGNRGILDHISGAWGGDENFDFSDLKNGTIQWCGIEESAGYGAPWEVYTDRDADGMLDYWEIKVRAYSASDAVTDYVWHVIPDEDLDGDGATNLEEYNNGTNPLVANAPVDPEWIVNYDSDSDSMADWWEQGTINVSDTDNLTSLADIRPNDDLDGDLSTNLEEHNVGTDPLSGPKHNFGMIIGYSGKDISLHHNFFAHHRIRTPLTGVEVLDHRNNVIYNAGLGITWHPPFGNAQRPGEPFKTNIVGNFFKPGPNGLKMQDTPTYFYPFIEGAGRSMIYGEGNYFDMVDEPYGYLDMFNPNRRGIYDSGSSYQADVIYPVPDVTTHTAEEAYGLVTAHAGSLPRDVVTSRNVEEIKTRTGKWGKEMPEGGLMEGLTPASPKKDSDDDGMPDEWENAVITVQSNTVNRGVILNPAVQDHNTIVKAGESVLMYNGQPVVGTENRYKGLTYIEYYINELADQLILKELIAAGYDQTDLPGYGKRPTPTVSWTPGYEQAGEYDITLTASDGMNTASQTVKVSVSNVIRKPVIYHLMVKKDGQSVSGHLWETIEPGENFNFEFYVKDPDGDDFTLTMENKPDGAIIKNTGRTRSNLKGGGVWAVYEFEWYPTLADVGWSETTSIVVTDTSGGIITRNFMLKVNEPSRQVYAITAQAGAGGRIDPSRSEILIQEGENITFSMHADDDYALSDVIVDGASVGVKGIYTFSNMIDDHTIEAVFEHKPGFVGGLIMHLDFDGDMQDSSAFANHGTAEGENAPTLTIDRFGNSNGAYDFDGINDYIQIQDSDLFDSLEYTVTAWIYARKSLYSQRYIVSKNNRGGTNSIGLYAVWNRIYNCGAGYPHSDVVLGGQENRWMHLAVSRSDKGVANFYLNGEYVGRSDTYPNTANDLDLIIGALNADAPSSFFDGIIDDVRIYNKALSADKIAAFVESELRIVTTSLPNGTVNQDYSYSISVTGGTPPYTWTYSDIPSWLTVNAVSETMREISGIPPQAGSFSFTVQIEDSASATVTNQFTLEVKEQTDSIAITTQSLPEAIVGSEYVASLNASGGTQPYVWSIDSNDLPAGLYLDGDNIRGIPEETGLYEFIVTVTDGSQIVILTDGSQKAAKNFCIKVTISDADVPDTDIPDIEVYETNYDFGSVNIGNSADWTFTIFNKGAAALTIHSISSDNQVFSIVSALFPAEIASGETMNVTARFTPQTEGEICGTFVINSNDPDEGKIAISIVGTGDNSDSAPNVVTVTLRDTTLDGYPETRKDKNLGGMGDLNIWSDGARKILLRPDLSQSPADAVIEKVELRLYCYSLYWPSYNPKLEVYRITHDWEEGEGIWHEDTDGGATWHEYDRDPVEINEWSTPGGDIDTITDFGYGPNGIVSEAVIQKDSWITFDITELTQKWISNEMENYGILIQAIDRGCNAAKFYSSEYEDENLRPLLVVSYRDGSAEALNIHSEISQGIQDTDYEASISAAGGNLPYQWSIQGLPEGLDWKYLDDTAITIYGIPTESGQFSLEVTVEDDNAQTLTTYLALTIVEPEPEPEPEPDTDTLRNNISDTTLDSYPETRKDKNLGGMGDLNIWSNGVRRILLRPDFSQISADAVIEKVELRLYCYSHYWPSYDPRLEVYRITHNWEEGEGIWHEDTDGGATWHEYDRNPVENNEWGTPGGDIDTITDFGYGPNGIVSEAVMQKDSWITFDITELTQKWISNEMENYGILIQAIDKGCNAAKFYSSEYEDENLRPNLTIQYLH
jgi:Concanavalin A-like lectin/glucanases superfamily/HYDIN/CFA65/VesB-like, Ig-like domain/Disaggregatase related repeat/Putative Ig domain